MHSSHLHSPAATLERPSGRRPCRAWLGGALTLLGCVGCAGEAAPPTSEAFRRDVLDQHPHVVVAVLAGSEEQQAAARQALNSLSRSRSGEVHSLAIDSASATWAVEEFALRSQPMLVVFQDGREVDRYLGDMRSGEVIQWYRSLVHQQFLERVAALDVEELILTDDTFDEVLAAADQPVLVDFWAPWCGPCRQLAPVVRLLGWELRDRLTIAKLNVDEHPQTAQRFVRGGIPLLVILHRGTVLDVLEGAPPPEALQQWVDETLSRIEPPAGVASDR